MRIFITIAALVFAVFATEAVLRYCVGFPDFGVEKYVIGLDYRGFDKCRVYKPHSRYYTTESGFKVYRRNNIGLIGSDYTDGMKNIYLLGSSYIEAKEVDPSRTASSILNSLCRDSGYQVLNIGYRGCTPYEQYTRLRYYATRYQHDLAVLVLDSTYDLWYKQRNFDMVGADSIKGFGQDDSNLSHNLYRILRNNSAFVNLLIPSLSSRESAKDGSVAASTEPPTETYQADYQKLFDSIKLIKTECPQMVVVSFVDDAQASDYLEDEMQAQGIRYFHADLKIPALMVNGIGHFNEKGNSILAEFIYESLLESGLLTAKVYNNNQGQNFSLNYGAHSTEATNVSKSAMLMSILKERDV